MKKLLTLILILNTFSSLKAQELECAVKVEAPKAQNIEPRVFRTMETAIFEFMNGRKWTNEKFQEFERIRCAMVINITESPTEGDYKANLIIQSQRPVYQSGYNTPVFIHTDREADFEYFEFQQLEFVTNGFTNNLTSILAFYAYIIIGYDFATFSPKGGEPYFQMAKAVLDAVPQSARGRFKGWNAFDGNRNRFYLIDGLLNPRFRVFQDVLYTYHYSGLDRMHEDVNTGRQAIGESIKSLEELNKDNPNNMLLRLFFVTKADELKNIYTGAGPAEKGPMVDLLTRLDPLNAEKYRDMLKM